MSVTRRDFLTASAAAGAALAAPAVHGADKDNKKYRTALVGSGWWGMNILRTAIEAGDVHAVALCDVDQNQLDPAAAEVEKLTGSGDLVALVIESAAEAKTKAALEACSITASNIN